MRSNHRDIAGFERKGQRRRKGGRGARGTGAQGQGPKGASGKVRSGCEGCVRGMKAISGSDNSQKKKWREERLSVK